MTPLDIIYRLQKAKRKNDKLTIIDEAYETCPEFIKGFLYAYDKTYKFSFPQVPEIEDVAELTEEDYGNPEDYTWDQFEYTLVNHMDHKISKEDAIQCWNEAAEVAHVLEWNDWYRRILQRNLKIGITKNTIEDVIEQFNFTNNLTEDVHVDIPITNELIPDILPYKTIETSQDEKIEKVSLSHDLFQMYETGNETDYIGEKYYDVLLTNRHLITIDRKINKVTIFNEYNEEILIDDVLYEYLTTFIKKYKSSIAIDCYFIKKDFNRLMLPTILKQDYIAINDVISLGDYKKGASKQTLSKRIERIEDVSRQLQLISNGRIYMIPKLCIDVDECIDILEFFEQELQDANYSSYLIKSPDSLYKVGDIKNWKMIDL